MKKRLTVLTLSGWGQAPDALDGIIPPMGAQIMHFPYHAYAGPTEVMAALKQLPEQPDVVVGWSLGAKLATTAIEQGVLKPKLFVQMGAAYKLPPGGGLDMATGGKPNGFYEAYKASPEHARTLLAVAMTSGDSRASVEQMVLKQDMQHDQDWLRWITKAGISFDNANFSAMPRTLIIQGANDAVVPPAQGVTFHKQIPNSRLEIIPECGHLPHLHAPQALSLLIAEEIRKQNIAGGVNSAAVLR